PTFRLAVVATCPFRPAVRPGKTSLRSLLHQQNQRHAAAAQFVIAGEVPLCTGTSWRQSPTWRITAKTTVDQTVAAFDVRRDRIKVGFWPSIYPTWSESRFVSTA